MGWYPLTTLAAALINLVLAVFIYVRGQGKRINILFANLLTAITIWVTASFVVNIANNAEVGLLWNRLMHIGAIMVPPTFIHFVADFYRPKKRTLIVPLTYLISIFLLTLLFNPLFIESVKKASYIGYAFKTGPFYYFFISFYAIAALYGFTVLYKSYKDKEGYKHQQAKYFLVSLLIAVFASIIFFPLAIVNSIDVPPIDNIIIIVFSITFTYAMFTYRLVDIKLVITKIFLFLFFTAIFLSTYTFISSLFFWILFKQINYTPIITATIPFAIFVGIFPPLRNGLLEYVDRLVYGGDYNYRNLIKESSEALVAILDLRELLGYLTDTISQNLKPQRLSLFLKDGHTYTIKHSSSLAAGSQKIADDSPLVSALHKTKRPLLSWEFESKTMKTKKVISTLKRLHAEVIVPLFVKDNLLGFLTLDTKKTGKGYSPQDIEVLNAIATTAAIALQNARLYEEAITDGLTGLYHHKYFQFRIKEELARAKRYRYPLSMIMLDIDHFKNINDKHGHQVGDQVLEELADLIKENLRLFDIVARYGGEEFGILLPAMGEETTKRHFEKAVSIAERLRGEVEAGSFSDQKLKLTISAGVAFFDGKDDEMTSRVMINESDKQLYRAKQGGRNKVCKVNISKKMLA